jgi:hypothetical protein
VPEKQSRYGRIDPDERKDTARRQSAGAANSPRRPRSAATLAEILRHALDAPSDDTGSEPRRAMTKREMMVRGLVARAADSDLAATRLLFDMLRKADPLAIAASDQSQPLGQDAIALLRERLARLARAQGAAAAPADTPSAETTPSSEVSD